MASNPTNPIDSVNPSDVAITPKMRLLIWNINRSGGTIGTPFWFDERLDRISGVILADDRPDAILLQETRLFRKERLNRGRAGMFHTLHLAGYEIITISHPRNQTSTTVAFLASKFCMISAKAVQIANHPADAKRCNGGRIAHVVLPDRSRWAASVGENK
jgi:hypothetical protein